MAIRNQYMDDLKQVAFAEAERLKGQELSQNYVGPMGILDFLDEYAEVFTLPELRRRLLRDVRGRQRCALSMSGVRRLPAI